MTGSIWALLLMATFVEYGHCELKLASYFADHMVLQRAPYKAVLWGTASTEGDTVTATVTGTGPPIPSVSVTVTEGKWKLPLPAIATRDPFVITVNSSEGSVTLNDVLFGDVWLCSGQSNMGFAMNNVINATAEMTRALTYKNVRYTKAKTVESNTPQTNMVFDTPWTEPTTDSIKSFSAVCWLYGEYLYDKLLYPIGLVESAWGGTPIEAWSSPEAIKDCTTLQTRAPSANSVLWNAMIHPLLGMTLYGAIWYQGEANAGRAEKYSCQIQAMLNHWRDDFNMASDGQTSKDFPFGYVQLAANAKGDAVGTFPAERWAQTANYGYSPNPALPNTFMAVAMDLPDFDSPQGTIHPRYKQDVAHRLVLGALHVAYGHNDVPFQGPFPTSFTEDSQRKTLTVEYDQGTTQIEVKTKDGFEVCCSSTSADTCDDAETSWVAAPITANDQSHVTVSYAACGSSNLVGLRYEWRTSPCEFKDCAIYAVESALPAPPYVTLKKPQ